MSPVGDGPQHYMCCVLDIISFAIYHSSRVSFLTCLNLYKIGEGIQFCFYEHIKIELKKQRKTIMLFSRFSPSVSDEVAIIESPYFYEEYIILGIDIFWYSYIRIYLYLYDRALLKICKFCNTLQEQQAKAE